MQVLSNEKHSKVSRLSNVITSANQSKTNYPMETMRTKTKTSKLLEARKMLVSHAWF